MNSISNQTREQGRKAFKAVAIVLSFLVYFAALLYAGVRSYDLFSRTLPADLLILAMLGILALELTAVGLPLAVHFWTEPGIQRYTAYAFYALDLALIVFNAILDAAANANTILPEFMQAYGVFAVPGLPVFCMLGWALIWLLDPSTQEHDAISAMRGAARKVLFEKTLAAVDEVDVTGTVKQAATNMARSIVSETVGEVESRTTRRKRAVEVVEEKPAAPEAGVTTAPKVPVSLNGKGSHNGQQSK